MVNMVKPLRDSQACGVQHATTDAVRHHVLGCLEHSREDCPGAASSRHGSPRIG